VNGNPHLIKAFNTKAPLLRLNHYSYRSLQFAIDVKACRSLSMAGMSGQEVNIPQLLKTMQDIDRSANQCDTLLAERQLYGTQKFSVTNAFATPSNPTNTNTFSFTRPAATSSSSSLSTNNHGNCPQDENIQALVSKESSLISDQILANMLVGIDPLQSASNEWTIGLNGLERKQQAALLDEGKAFINLGQGCGIVVKSKEEMMKLDSDGLLKPIVRDWSSCQLKSRSDYFKLAYSHLKY